MLGAVGGALLLSAGCAAPPVPPSPTDVPTPTPQPPVATAVAALSSGPTATQVAIAAATSIAASTIHITDATVDPSNVSASAVTLSNAGTSAVDMGGWVLLVVNYRVTLPKTDYMMLVPGRSMIVHLSTSPTPTNGQNVYVGLGALQNTPRVNADRIVLINPDGHIASLFPAQS